jgi:serine protease Do
LALIGALAALSPVGTLAAAAPATRPAAPTTRPFTLRPSTLPATVRTPVAPPKGLDDLRDIERRVKEVMKKAAPATVAVLMGGGQGSGVIISRDGYVLTAGHVARQPNVEIALILGDGRRVRAKTLGMNLGIDSGLIKITQAGEWPYVEMGNSTNLRPGQWVLGLGHPGGYRKDRPAVLRIGRVLTSSPNLITTDCTLVGGDSGGPLFDLDGRVVGIHSRIGASTLANIHVPVDSFAETWDRLAAAETWGERFASGSRGPMLGVVGEAHENGCRVTEVIRDGPAAKAGLKVGDVIARMDGRTVEGIDGLVQMIVRRRPGQEVSLQVLRGEETLEMKATLIRRPTS